MDARPVSLLPIGGVGCNEQVQLGRMRERAAELSRAPKRWRSVGNLTGCSIRGRRRYPPLMFQLEFRRVNRRGGPCTNPRPMTYIVVGFIDGPHLAVRWSLVMGFRPAAERKTAVVGLRTPKLGGRESVGKARETAG